MNGKLIYVIVEINMAWRGHNATNFEEDNHVIGELAQMPPMELEQPEILPSSWYLIIPYIIYT
jgi:hypothetical protein